MEFQFVVAAVASLLVWGWVSALGTTEIVAVAVAAVVAVSRLARVWMLVDDERPSHPNQKPSQGS
nr:hypothetical protein [Thermoleptolyngbya oregonensis]